ncbi:MAG: DNA gyrase inhibitor YacG [Acetobacter sp.]|nr:DNA gyrase inhibitor YacG [Acetobacter sp.]MBR2124023.1 DNA gyrase inhibitor YacG [Acetobacter sp.]
MTPLTPPKHIPDSVCPICQKPTAVEFRPFCSRRCADIDLGRWLSEEYRVPSTEDFPPSPNNEREFEE